MTLAAGAASADLTVKVLNDSETEGRERMFVTLQPSAVYALGTGAVATITLIDDAVARVPVANAGPDAEVYADAPLALAGSLSGSDRYLASGDYWIFDDTGVDRRTTWRGLSFSDATWGEGLGKFGYGDGNESTTVSFGPNSSSRQITTYFRRRFHVRAPASVGSLAAGLLADDGAVVYLNGAEVIRSNLPAGTIAYATRAVNALGGADEDTYVEWALNPGQLVAGENILAVELHQQSATSADVGFDLTLRREGLPPPSGTSVQWEKISCAGSVRFSNAGEPVTTATFDLSGTYVLRLRAGESADEVTVLVRPVPTYASWAATFPALVGPTAASAVLTLQPEGLPVDNGDGSETVTVRLVPPLGSDARWFARLSVAVVP